MARRQRRDDRRRADAPFQGDEAESHEGFDTPDPTNNPGRLAILSDLHGRIATLPLAEKRVFGPGADERPAPNGPPRVGDQPFGFFA
jgi:hypothetical protein